MIVSYPVNNQEAKAIKAVLKALNVKFEIKKDKEVDFKESSKDEILNNIKSGIEDLKQYKKGKLKTTNANDFLNEL